ncbi:MAG: hypothetical protein ACUVTG_13540 [Candidatus Oleimicrobiaceae bacterium]
MAEYRRDYLRDVEWEGLGQEAEIHWECIICRAFQKGTAEEWTIAGVVARGGV